MVNDDSLDFLVAHRTLGVATAGICAFVSLSLIARLWVLHRRAPTMSKILWSIVLLLPVFGWLFFAAFYRAPASLSWTGTEEHGFTSGGTDGHGTTGAGDTGHF
jgi:hypothetical protein